MDSAKFKRSTHRWARWLHVYTSMISLLIVLFFGVTGITLNHPTWTIGDTENESVTTSTFPFPVESNGQVDFLSIAEHVRSVDGVSGSISEYRSSATEGSMSFKGPGYSADLRFTIADGNYEIVTTRQGLLGVMNDLHKGRDTSSSWKWVIDISAALLVAVSITGLTMQFFLAKRRRSAFAVAFVGVLLALGCIVATLA